jgi:TRAP-type C4-dicarboxylate transport system permease small subunit
MTREGMIIFLGIMTSIQLFIGLPLSLLQWTVPVTGVLITLIGLAQKKKRMQQQAQENVEEVSVPLHTQAHPSPYQSMTHDYTTSTSS